MRQSPIGRELTERERRVLAAVARAIESSQAVVVRVYKAESSPAWPRIRARVLKAMRWSPMRRRSR